MDDRLKFRAWVEDVSLEDENGNEYKKSFMIYDIAVFGGCRVGHYKEDLERQLESQGFSEDEIKQFENDWCSEDGNDWLNFDADEIEQCTGLKDKNGKLIYEGDIVELTRSRNYGWVKKGAKLKVQWNTFNCCGFGFGTLGNLTEKCATNCIVIGNIHENPDLIKSL